MLVAPQEGHREDGDDTTGRRINSSLCESVPTKRVAKTFLKRPVATASQRPFACSDG